MWTVLTAWDIQLRMAMARLQLTIAVGSLPMLAMLMPKGLLSAYANGQHQPWTWVLL